MAKNVPIEVRVEELTRAVSEIAQAICRPGVAWNSPDGGKVGDLTEATIFVGQQIGRLASAMQDIADVMRDREEREED